MRYTAAVALLVLLRAATPAFANERPGIDLVVLVDRSDSVAATSPLIRHLLDQILHLIARSADAAHLTHRLAVVSFGSTTHVDLPFTTVHGQDLSPLRQAIDAAPQRLGTTDMLSAFAAANALFAGLASDSSRRRAVIILTDGVPYPPQDREDLRRFVAANFALQSITIDAFLLSCRCRRDVPMWRALSRDRVHELTENEGATRAVVQQVVTNLIGTRYVESESARTSDPVVQQLVVPPYLELVVFDIFHARSSDTVEAMAPGVDHALRPGADGVEEWHAGSTFSTIAVRRPAPGRWIFHKSRRDASVRIFAEEFFPRGVVVLRPSADSVRQHDRVEIGYRLVDEHGQPLQELAHYPLTLNVSLGKPDGSHDTLEMIRDSTPVLSLFRARPAMVCDLPGRYWTEVLVRTRDIDGRSIDVFDDHWSGFFVSASGTMNRGAAAQQTPATARMSLAERLGLPAELVTSLLMITLAASLVPWFGGSKIGSVEVPKVSPKRRRVLRVAGPLFAAGAAGLVVPLEVWAPPAIRLQLEAVDFTDDGKIDVAIANTGTAAALLTRIDLEVLKDYRWSVRSALAATATWRVPVGASHAGERRSLVIRHIIPPAATERILISPETTRSLDVRLRICASDGTVLVSNVRLWPEVHRVTPTPGISSLQGGP